MDLNKVSVIGNAVTDPTTTKSDVTFSIATNYIWKEKNRSKKSVEFHEVVASGHLADIIKEYVHKGDKVYIEGGLRHREVKQDNHISWQTYINAEDIIMLGHRKEKHNGLL